MTGTIRFEPTGRIRWFVIIIAGFPVFLVVLVLIILDFANSINGAPGESKGLGLLWGSVLLIFAGLMAGVIVYWNERRYMVDVIEIGKSVRIVMSLGKTLSIDREDILGSSTFKLRLPGHNLWHLDLWLRHKSPLRQFLSLQRQLVLLVDRKTAEEVVRILGELEQ